MNKTTDFTIAPSDDREIFTFEGATKTAITGTLSAGLPVGFRATFAVCRQCLLNVALADADEQIIGGDGNSYAVYKARHTSYVTLVKATTFWFALLGA